MTAPLLSVDEARRRLNALMPAMAAETVALDEAAGRVLAADAVAGRAQPPFAASAMDGYAVRAAEAVAGARLRVAGEAAAGHAWAGRLPEGAAVRIFTGAPVPEGADAILIQEDAEREGDTVTVREAPGPGAYLRPAGGDFAAGFRLEAPRRLGPREVALLAAMGHDRVSVARRPVVALVATGDELVAPGARPRPDQVFASNDRGLSVRLAMTGARVVRTSIAADDRASLIGALGEARAAGADVVVTLGGASVGEHDLVAAAFGDAGLSLGFHRIAMRPGKPLMAGRLPGGAAMIGLPGNPVSAMVCGEIFAVPAIERALGLPGAPARRRPVALAEGIEANGPREHYARARLDAEGRAVLAANQDSSLLTVLAEADGLVVRAPRAPAAAAGEAVEFIDLP
ncbi:MAG: gephyrin-like molybdotransferase Glp [Paracoccaceae bacterium]